MTKDGAFMKKISLLLALCIAVTMLLTSCGEKFFSTDEDDYYEYLEKVTGAAKLMPLLTDVGEYSSFEATYKHSRTALLYELDTVGLFLTFEDEEAFLDAVEDLSYEHVFYEKYPDEQKTDFEAEVDGYVIKMVKEEYELSVYQSAYLIGVNEEAKKICYLYYYDFDMDVLEDLDSYIDEHFYLK